MRRVKGVFGIPLDAFVCNSCRQQHLPSRAGLVARRFYAVVASSPEPQVTETSASPILTPLTEDASKLRYSIKAGNLVSRAPLLTAPLSSFESAFYFYQRRLNERLALPFPQYFYFKRNTPTYENWKARRRERGWVATRDIGSYNAHKNDSWNDEALIGNQEDVMENIVRKLVEEEGRETFPPSEDAKDLSKPLRGLRRITEADRKNDTKSLERALSRTLYLVVKTQMPGKEKGVGIWQFPSGIVEGGESLRQAAERSLDAACGSNMNTWFVANHPVGHFIYNFSPNKVGTSISSSEESASLGEKTFFLKSRILAGRADIASNSMDVLDFQWLAKEEVQDVVPIGYWGQVKNMLAER